MKIRPIIEEDIPAVVDLILQNYDEVMPAYHSPGVLEKSRLKVTPDQIRAQVKTNFCC